MVICAQNWKILLNHAAKTMGKTPLILLGVIFVAFVPVGLIFKLLGRPPLVTCLIVWTIMMAFFSPARPYSTTPRISGFRSGFSALMEMARRMRL